MKTGSPSRVMWLTAILLVVPLWCLGVASWWRSSVPFLPTWRIPLEGQAIWPYSPAEEKLLLAGKAQDGKRSYWTGPLDIYDTRTGERLARRLDKSDQILAIRSRGWDVAAALRDGSVSIVDLKTGEQRCKLSVTLQKYRMEHCFFDNGRIIVFNAVDGLEAFSTSTGERKWSLPDSHISLGARREYLASQWRLVPCYLNVGTGFRPCRLIDAQTGQLVPWLKNATAVIPSECGRFVFITSWSDFGRSSQICRATDGTLLFPSVNPLVDDANEAQEAEAFYHSIQARSAISGIQMNARNAANYLSSPDEDSKSTLTTRLTEPSALPTLVAPIWPAAANWLRRMAGDQQLEIYDTVNLKSVGLFPGLDTSGGPMRWLNYRSGFLVETTEAVTYVGPPFNRNWRLLAMLTTLPSIAWLALWAFLMHTRTTTSQAKRVT